MCEGTRGILREPTLQRRLLTGALRVIETSGDYWARQRPGELSLRAGQGMRAGTGKVGGERRAKWANWGAHSGRCDARLAGVPMMRAPSGAGMAPEAGHAARPSSG